MLFMFNLVSHHLSNNLFKLLILNHFVDDRVRYSSCTVQNLNHPQYYALTQKSQFLVIF